MKKKSKHATLNTADQIAAIRPSRSDTTTTVNMKSATRFGASKKLNSRSPIKVVTPQAAVARASARQVAVHPGASAERVVIFALLPGAPSRVATNLPEFSDFGPACQVASPSAQNDQGAASMTLNRTGCLTPAQAARELSRVGLSICDLNTRLGVRRGPNICIPAAYWRPSSRRAARPFRGDLKWTRE